ncbi:hypothetical protein M378DRAFT_169505 [Amanita muscaria Koide BX008]|uniref:Uncharacterized protein n=1 Tax=Amanita muscaria (strain Koide BX008) TaxID=946122 RepID=A0A0C2WR69_AMAMK|nr:hypothetical protein M378DRAFT_169505 [Amanita muscaria Koide BX008]
MGTNVSLSEFVPAADDLKSGRLAGEMLLLLPPYTALGFDQNINGMDLSPHQTMGQVRSLERICAYGRPLWNAGYVSAASGGDSMDETTFFQDARMKLLCSDKFNGEDIYQVFAILSYTVCLDLVLGNRKATELANTSVAKHMRLLIDVNDHRTVFTKASSEPVLALVGAYIAAKANNLLDIIEGLTNNLCKDGLVDKGRHGELLARMILFIARIQSCSAPLTPLSFAAPVPVVDFLKTLFGEELWDKTPGHKCFEEGLKGGYVNFHHFTLTRDEMPVKEDLNLEANLWARGTAVQCKFEQVDVDGHIPVYWGSIDEDEPFDPSNFSNLNYQVKFSKAGDTVSADRIQRRASDRASKHPFIAVFLDMGNEQTYMSTGSRLSLETGAETLQRLSGTNSSGQKTARTAKKAKKTLELDANRYCINARGCDEDVFGVLKTMGIAEKWKTLVEITVETPASERDIVKTMQPLYRFDPALGHCDWMHDYSALHDQA